MYLALFLAAVVIDYIASMVAIKKGNREGNPALLANPLLVGFLSAVVIIVGAEGFKAAGYSDWAVIYWIGAVFHAIGAVWNGILIWKGKK